jgi:DNA-binding NtrC family response regulator
MSLTGKVLIVDDEEPLRKVVRSVLAAEGYEVFLAKEGVEALSIATTQTLNVAIVDKQMPRMDGLEVIRRLREIQPRIVPIMLTAHGSLHDAVEAGKLGAHDYLTKPFENANLLLVVRLAVENSRMRGELNILNSQNARGHSVESILGESSQMQMLRKQILKLAGSDTTVLILGESGTGKELAAQAIHYESKRRSKPFVVIDCASIPPELIQSELFGHERGAFTDAREQRLGKFESADGGSVFLDEIGELHPEAQAKLLRVLQEKEIVRVGGGAPIPVNIRIIAATNRSLEEMVTGIRFRQDLLFRLNVARLLLPPLREHREDISLYVNHFIQKYRASIGSRVDSISEEAMAWLSGREWQGNVRELENRILGALANCEGNRLETGGIMECAEKDSAPERGEGLSHPGLLARMEEEAGFRESELIREVLEETHWNQTVAAGRLGISRRTLYSKMQRFGLK